jgi:hypothetical protein
MKVLFCNSVEISSSKEVFLLTFHFIAPDGDKASVHVVLTPSGAMTVHSLLGKELEDYIKKHGATKSGRLKKKLRLRKSLHTVKSLFFSGVING